MNVLLCLSEYQVPISLVQLLSVHMALTHNPSSSLAAIGIIVQLT